MGTLTIIQGTTGTGKSTVAQALQKQGGVGCLVLDEVTVHTLDGAISELPFFEQVVVVMRPDQHIQTINL